ncbi:hypothetical protein EJ03DRAFT_350566 [Teratosphaeria nubilosa]|uniref:Uncharacterized protein n=1 Tax=Teratosphaeria nubilosa TaxID=161662 RepID=A0A6G1LCD2_9PEZI|nr:hypothetical protein EJ03DRAFT_350566 [Teratosphaeria nubilosa]
MVAPPDEDSAAEAVRLDEITAALAQYSKATTLRDLEDMLARRPAVFDSISGYLKQRKFQLRAVRNSEDIWTDKLRDAIAALPGPLNNISHLGKTRSLTETVKRSVVAIFGGVTLLVSMIIMSFRTSREA